MSTDEQNVCSVLLDDAAVLIDSYGSRASAEAKMVVSCRMVIRALGDGDTGSNVPVGASQGSMSALGYSQSWTIGSGGATGELYVSRTEKKMLGVSNRIGSYSPTQELAPPPITPDEPEDPDESEGDES